MKKKFFILSLSLFLLMIANSVYATHYVTGNTSVDDGEIRWGGSTQFSTAWSNAISTWNALGDINIAPDTLWTYQDLSVGDFYYDDYPMIYGIYDYDSVGSDELWLNEYVLSGQNSSYQQNTATHELGHALGLDDHSIFENVMYEYQTSRTSLGSQDISDYNYLWD